VVDAGSRVAARLGEEATDIVVVVAVAVDGGSCMAGAVAGLRTTPLRGYLP
jgi:hypothetical protein